MKYVPPLDADDPDDSYVDRNTPGATRGSVVSGPALEHGMREIVHCIVQGGKVPDENDLTQLWQVIEDRATSVSTFLQVYPEIDTSDNRMPLTASGGTIIFPDTVDFSHRGGPLRNLSSVTLANRTFTTLANTKYHARMQFTYNATTGVYDVTPVLIDILDATYNPVPDPEFDNQFDTTLDDALIALVETDGSNVATVTTLRNANGLVHVASKSGIERSAIDFGGYTNTVLNWARTPLITFTSVSVYDFSNFDVSLIDFGMIHPTTRYDVDLYVRGYDIGSGEKISGAFVAVLRH